MDQNLQALQGVWQITSLEVDAQKMPAAMLAAAQIRINGSRFESTGMGATYEGHIAVNPDASSAQIDMTFDAGPEAGNTNLGIYELSGGDSWRLCLATRGTVRPQSFGTVAGSGIALETLSRARQA